jgi:hypothetical protein
MSVNQQCQLRADAFRSSERACFLRRQAARPPKKLPAAVNTQIVMVTAVSLVVIMSRLPVEKE